MSWARSPRPSLVPRISNCTLTSSPGPIPNLVTARGQVPGAPLPLKVSHLLHVQPQLQAHRQQQWAWTGGAVHHFAHSLLGQAQGHRLALRGGSWHDRALGLPPGRPARSPPWLLVLGVRQPQGPLHPPTLEGWAEGSGGLSSGRPLAPWQVDQGLPGPAVDQGIKGGSEPGSAPSAGQAGGEPRGNLH